MRMPNDVRFKVHGVRVLPVQWYDTFKGYYISVATRATLNNGLSFTAYNLAHKPSREAESYLVGQYVCETLSQMQYEKW